MIVTDKSILGWQDATTNPSLILAAAGKPGYARLIDNAVNYAKQKGGSLDEQTGAAVDRLVRCNQHVLIRVSSMLTIWARI